MTTWSKINRLMGCRLLKIGASYLVPSYEQSLYEKKSPYYDRYFLSYLVLVRDEINEILEETGFFIPIGKPGAVGEFTYEKAEKIANRKKK